MPHYVRKAKKRGPARKVGPCEYRSKDPVDSIKCNTCGNRGTIVQIFECSRHEKRCSEIRVQDRSVNWCKSCDNGPRMKLFD